MKRLSNKFAREQEEKKNKEKAGRLDVAVTLITAIASILTLPEGANGFRAFDCNNTSNPVDHYLLLEPGPCPDVLRTYQLERTLEGKIVQMKKGKVTAYGPMPCGGNDPKSVLRMAELRRCD